MNIWTQCGPDLELRMRKVMLDGLDAVVQAGTGLLTKLEVCRHTAGPTPWPAHLLPGLPSGGAPPQI